MSSEVIVILIFAIATWNLVGVFLFLHNLGDFAYLNPIKIYLSFKVNYFGCFVLTILFNIACPIATIIYWICVFIHWICTVGRK